ncbi:MAG: DNA primase [Elusimicrobiota bacterium]|jgi:DNA primase|nr:DNA primase [Elusimicrobiota bacterium]
MPISEETVERIRSANDIVSVIREYAPDLKRSGRNWQARCPFHDEKTPSFIVSPEKGIFKCFGCGAAGDVVKFMMMIENTPWIEALKKLAAKASIEIRESRDETVKYSQKTKLYDILESAALFYNRHLNENPKAERAQNYLQKRGISKESIKKFKLGFAPQGALLQSSAKKGFSAKDLLDAGLIAKTSDGSLFEFMSERIVFPIFDVSGRVSAFGGRTLNENKTPKYINTPETAVYSKSAMLYGLFQTLPSVRKEKKIIVLEGYIDVIIPQQFGISGAAASLGTSFTNKQAKLISRYADKVLLLFDPDDAGRNAAQRALEILAEDASLDISVSSLPENIDADEYIIKFGKEKFLKHISDNSKSAIDFMIEKTAREIGLNSPSSKVKTASILADFISKNPDEIIRREWIRKTSQEIDAPEEYILKELRKRKISVSKSVYSQRKTSANADLSAQKGLSLEESLLNLVLNFRELLPALDISIFEDERCRKICAMAMSGSSDSAIAGNLSQEDAEWFSSVSFKFSQNAPSAQEQDAENSAEKAIQNERNISAEERFEIHIRDIRKVRLKREFEKLSREVQTMLEGKAEMDKNKLDKYYETARQLKGIRR